MHFRVSLTLIRCFLKRKTDLFENAFQINLAVSPIRLVWTTKTDLSVNAVVTPQLQVKTDKKTDKKNYALWTENLRCVLDAKTPFSNKNVFV